MCLSLGRHREAPASTPGLFQPFQSRQKKLMWNGLQAFLKDKSGATAIEYGLITGGIAVAIITVVNGLGTKLNTTFSYITTNM